MNLDVGILTEHWGSSESGTIGLAVGVEKPLSGALALHGKASLSTGWGVSGELDVKGVTAGLALLQGVVGDWLALRAGPVLSVMSFSGEHLNPERVTSTLLAGELELVLAPRVGSANPWLSLGARGYASDRRVVVGDREQLRVPRLAALFGLGVRF